MNYQIQNIFFWTNCLIMEWYKVKIKQYKAKIERNERRVVGILA